MRTRRIPKNQDRLFRELGKEKAPTKPCEWKEDDNGCWWTDCGNGFEFLTPAATPQKSKMAFCMYCGKPLKEIRSVDDFVVEPCEGEKACDSCASQEGKHYCLLHGEPMKNMDIVKCPFWEMRPDEVTP
jgi:hypothetical protein